MSNETHYFECQCYSPEHTLHFNLDLDEDEPEIYTTIFLSNKNWWRRLWIAVKYIFGYRCKYGHFDCFILNPKDAKRLRNLCDQLIQESTGVGE